MNHVININIYTQDETQRTLPRDGGGLSQRPRWGGRKTQQVRRKMSWRCWDINSGLDLGC